MVNFYYKKNNRETRKTNLIGIFQIFVELLSLVQVAIMKMEIFFFELLIYKVIRHDEYNKLPFGVVPFPCNPV